MNLRAPSALLALLLGGCVRAVSPLHDANDLQPLIHECGMVGQMDLKYVGTDEVTAVILTENADDKGFMCVLRGIEARGLKLGIIGRN